MCKPDLFASVVARVTRRRGRLGPRRAAHVVAELQNGFMAPGQLSVAATAP